MNLSKVTTSGAAKKKAFFFQTQVSINYLRGLVVSCPKSVQTRDTPDKGATLSWRAPVLNLQPTFSMKGDQTRQGGNLQEIWTIPAKMDR